MHRVAGWWDGFELWVAGLPFIPQFLVVLVGMVPISFAIAYVLDRALRAILRILDRHHDDANIAAHGFDTAEFGPERLDDLSSFGDSAQLRDSARLPHVAGSGAR